MTGCRYGRKIAVRLERDEFMVIVNVVINGERHGRWPVYYTVPGAENMDRDELAPLVRTRVAEITRALGHVGGALFAGPEREGGYELRLSEGQDPALTWFEKAPDTPEGIE